MLHQRFIDIIISTHVGTQSLSISVSSVSLAIAINLCQSNEMEVRDRAVFADPAVSTSFVVCPVIYEVESTQKRTPFMIDDLVGNQINDFMSSRPRGFVDLKNCNDFQSPISEGNPKKEDVEEAARYPCTKSHSTFSVEQVLQLERVFERQKYIGSRDRQRLAEQLQMTKRQIKTWFQNRRMKMKKKQIKGLGRREKLCHLDNLAHNIQLNYHGYQPCYSPPYPPPGVPRLLSVTQSEYAWPQQSQWNFPPNHLPRIPPPVWDSYTGLSDTTVSCASLWDHQLQPGFSNFA